MEAVILAGGLGTRLRPLTSTVPKPLLPVVNVPVVERIIAKMPDEVTKVVLAVSYKADQLQAHFDAHDCGKEVVLVQEDDPLGTGGALRNVADHVTGTFLAFNGDVLDSLDVSALLAFHREKEATATLALWQVRDPRPFGVVAMTNSRISRFVEKPESKDDAPSLLANAGTYVLEPSVLDLIAPGEVVSFERATLPALIAGGKAVHGYPFKGFWVDVGRPDTYLKANEKLLRHAGERFALGPGAVVPTNALDDWAVLGAGCTVGEASEVRRSVLLANVRVGANAAVKESILAEDTVVEDDAVVVDCILGAGAVVKKGVYLKNVNVEPGDVIGEDTGA